MEVEKSHSREDEGKKMEVEKSHSREDEGKNDEVMKLVSSRLSQRELISLLLVSSSLFRTLSGNPYFWQVLDFREMSNAGDRLVSALSLRRYSYVKHINLEFARDVDDKHLELLSRSKCADSLLYLEHLNLNGCQKISDKGIEAIARICPKLKSFSIYWNVRVTDIGIKHLVESCKRILDLNLSGCNNLTDKSLQLIADNYDCLDSLNLTRCVKLTNSGLQQILSKCCLLRSLNLYALSNFTDQVYCNMRSLDHLRFLDLCGAQNLSDESLLCISNCHNLVAINLTWCVRVTDAGVIALAESCTSLEFLSLFGIVSVTDKSLDVLSRKCSTTLTTLDVNGCIGIRRRDRDYLIKIFPLLKCFKVHS